MPKIMAHLSSLSYFLMAEFICIWLYVFRRKWKLALQTSVWWTLTKYLGLGFALNNVYITLLIKRALCILSFELSFHYNNRKLSPRTILCTITRIDLFKLQNNLELVLLSTFYRLANSDSEKYLVYSLVSDSFSF